jgi:hypothetical protein
MTTYQLSKTARSFTLGDLTYSIGSVLLRKDGDYLIIGEGVNALKFRYDQFIGTADETFASAALAVVYLEEQVFKVGGAGGVGSEDVSNITLITQEDYDDIVTPVSTTLYLIPE